MNIVCRYWCSTRAFWKKRAQNHKFDQYSTRAFWKKRAQNHKFDQCVSQKDMTSCRRDIVTSDTSGLYDYFIFNVVLLLLTLLCLCLEFTMQ